MSGANVTSLEAIARFRASLVLFLERAALVIDETGEEVKRTRGWLQSEQRIKLQQLRKRHERELERLEQELFSARLSDLAQKKTGAQMLVNRKRRELRDLEETERKIVAWSRNFDSTVEPEARKVEKLRHFIDTDMARAVSFLAEAIRQLDAYATDGNP